MAPPSVEKFYFPCWFRIRLSSGFSIVIPVMFRDFDVISGIISTPTLKDFALRKGALPKAGSSAIDRLEAVSDPEKMDRLKSPTCTLRLNAVESFSMAGLNELALMNRGRAKRNGCTS